MKKLAIFPIPYPNIRGTSFAGTVEQVGSSVTASRADDCVAVNRSSAMFMKPTSGDFNHFVTAITADALTLFGGSASVGGFAVHFGCQSRLYRYHHLLLAQRTYRVLLGPTEVINHTEPFSSVIAELNAAGLYGAIVDTIGLPPVNAILSQVLTEKGGELSTTNPPTELLELPHNVQRKMERLPAAIEQPENEGFRGWFDVILGKCLGNALAEKPVASEKIEKVTVD